MLVKSVPALNIPLVYKNNFLLYISMEVSKAKKEANVKAVLKHRAKNVDKYNQYQKQFMADRRTDPQIIQKEKEAYEKNKDKINQRRRELYALKKKKNESANKIQNAFRNKKAINELADRFVKKQILNYYK